MPALTKAVAGGMILDPSFAPVTNGNTYAQALYLADAGGHDLVFVTTEQNEVSAFWASNGSVAWQRVLAPPMPLAALPCGNIDPLGITGTGVLDPVSRTLYLDAMTDTGGNGAAHEIYALDVDTGATRAGWPVDANTAIAAGGVTFDSSVQNERGALTILGGRLYVPFGGHYGDCGNYYGWVVGISQTDPTSITTWRARDQGIAIWAPGGIASDGRDLYVATGNGFGGAAWMDSEALMRLQPGPVFSELPVDYMVPANWQALDNNDIDLGGTAPVLFDMPGAAHAQLAAALGKDGKLYLADRTNLGGIGGALAITRVSQTPIINASVAYTTAQGSYLAFKGDGLGCPNGPGNLTAVRITAGEPPTAEVAWCADQGGEGSPMVTQTQAEGGDTIVWSVGSEGDKRLHGFDGDTGAVVYAGGGAAEQMGAIRRFVTPIFAGGRLIVAGDNKVYAFKAP